MVPPPLDLTSAISQVFKVIAELDICNQRTAQVGKLQLLVAEGAADIMVSISPTPYGDAIRVTIESNTTSAEEIQKQFTEIRQNRQAEPVRKSWLQKLWNLALMV